MRKNPSPTVAPQKPSAGIACLALAFGAGPLPAAVPPAEWGNDVWRLQIDQSSGALVRIENRGDPRHMNWLRGAGHWEGTKWIADASSEAITLDGQWGLVESPQIGLLHIARVRQVSDHAWESVYTSSILTVSVHRELDESGGLLESYTFKNTGAIALDFPVGSLAIAAPFFDQYPDAKLSQTARCHTHLWMGGSSAWINALRMDTKPPHLGLVLTQGSLDAYSLKGATYNDRGVFLLHPAAMTLERGRSVTIAWRLFWNTGWDDFFSQLGATPGFVRMTARDYTVPAGQALEIAVESATSLDSAQLLANGGRVETRMENGRLKATIPTTAPGEVRVELRNRSQTTWLRANVVPSVEDLVDARVRFIVRHQQRNASGDPLDGAYLAYDNETGRQVYDRSNDHNAGRERMAMGVLGALYLPLCHDEAFKAELEASLLRYSAFVTRELEDDSGEVFNNVGRAVYHRLYNFPWAAHFHLAMYRATRDQAQLDRYVTVLKKYYAQGGAKFYAIGIPITEGLKALEEAGRTEDRTGLLASFRAHADQFLKTGTDYPTSEVNYEQSIVAPSVQLLAEVYLATGEKSYLEELKRQMPLLEAFAGQQPDFRLNEVSIRHWDDYWFGKMRLYGDTFPHYWSTLNAGAFACYGRITGERRWFDRADTVLKANLSLFDPDGSATCAHVYPLTSNGQAGARNDPWANDQDWALVNLLGVREIVKAASH